MQATLTVPAFNPANLINAPAGATHFRLLLPWLVFLILRTTIKPELMSQLIQQTMRLSDVAYSGYLDLCTALAASTVVTATLPGTPTLTADASVLFCIGIEFYQKVGPNYYLFNSGNALKVADIF